MTDWVDFTVPGTPKGKGRPKFVRATGRAYTPAETVEAEGDVGLAWLGAGAPRLDGPLQMELTIVLERPKSHFKADGSLSAAGQREPWAIRKPDVDNAWKLALDALQGKAFRDDVAVVDGKVVKRWAVRDETAHTRIRLRALVDLARVA